MEIFFITEIKVSFQHSSRTYIAVCQQCVLNEKTKWVTPRNTRGLSCVYSTLQSKV